MEVKKFRSKNVAITDINATNILDIDNDKEIRVKISNGTHQIGVDSDKRQTVKITGGDNVNQADVINQMGIRSLIVSPGVPDQFHINIDANNVGATAGFMLIDISDTVNWPHTFTNHIIIKWLSININPNTSYVGDIEIGFLSDVGIDNGDFNILKKWHLERSTVEIVDFLNGQFGHFSTEPAVLFGEIQADDTTWQTDVNLQGPNGVVEFPSGNGDLVMKVNQTAGNVDVGLTLAYTTVA